MVSWECKQELFRQEIENSADMRLSIVLLRACMGEKQAFCNLLQPGAFHWIPCRTEPHILPAVVLPAPLPVLYFIEVQLGDAGSASGLRLRNLILSRRDLCQTDCGSVRCLISIAKHVNVTVFLMSQGTRTSLSASKSCAMNEALGINVGLKLKTSCCGGLVTSV